MGSTVHPKRVWHDVVKEKRRARAESIEAFEQGNETPEALRDRCPALDGAAAAASTRGGEIVASLTRREFSCEDLIRWHIHKFVNRI